MIPAGLGQQILVVISDGGRGSEGQTQLYAGILPVAQGNVQIAVKEAIIGIGLYGIVNGKSLAGIEVGHLSCSVKLHNIRQFLVVFCGKYGLEHGGSIRILTLIDGVYGDAVLVVCIEVRNVLVHQHAGFIGSAVPEGDGHRLGSQ